MMKLSKILGYGISFGSFLVKIPQLLKIYKNKSVAGLNLNFYSELISQCISILYAYQQKTSIIIAR